MNSRERNDKSVDLLQQALRPVKEDKDDEPFIHKVVSWKKPFDVNSVEIEQNVPPPSGMVPRQKGKYTVLFEKLKPGDSFTLPNEMKKQVAEAIQSWRRAGHKEQRFAVRTEANKVRVWRLADVVDSE